MADWVLDSLTGKSGPVPVGHISAQSRNGKVVGYSVYLGVDGQGRKQRRYFTQRSDAEKFQQTHRVTPLPVGELLERKTEILYCLEQLKPLNVTLPDVVSFYIRHRGHKGNPTLSQLVELFITEKKRVGRSEHYEKSIRYYTDGLMKYLGKDILVGDITREQITSYIYQHNSNAGAVTKKNILTHLSVLFNFGIKEDLLGVNPVEKITRPTIKFHKPHVLTPADFEKLLRRCVELDWNDRLVVFVLVGFCGIRTEEVARLNYTNLQLDKRIVEVPATVAKKASFRNNVIPPNAMKWLESVHDKRRRGEIIKDGWSMKLRSAVLSAEIDYRQNCIRHSFCSYALASGWALADVIAYMGHSGSPSVIFSHYRNVVSAEDGKRWFSIVP